jgi:hypothetical protein
LNGAYARPARVWPQRTQLTSAIGVPLPQP